MNENVLQSIASMTRRWTRVTILATSVHPDSPAWDELVWRRTQALLSEYGWDLLEIPNQYDLRGRYVGMPEWRSISRTTSELLERIVHGHGGSQTGVLSSDVPFLGVVLPRAATWLHVTHTLAALQAPDDHEWNRWEVENYGTWLARNGRIAVPSEFLRTRLLTSWPALRPHVLLWRNGYRRSEFRATPVRTERRLSILAYGRALPRKGLHLVVAAVDALNACGLRVRLTLIAIPEVGHSEYVRQLNDMAKASEATRFIPGRLEDISIFLGDDDLAAVVVPSLDEPAGLAPIET